MFVEDLRDLLLKVNSLGEARQHKLLWLLADQSRAETYTLSAALTRAKV